MNMGARAGEGHLPQNFEKFAKFGQNNQGNKEKFVYCALEISGAQLKVKCLRSF